jgi:hypothetical protein
MIKKQTEIKNSINGKGEVTSVENNTLVLTEITKKETLVNDLKIKDFEAFVDKVIDIKIHKAIKGTVSKIDMDNGIVYILNDKSDNGEEIEFSINEFKNYMGSVISFSITEKSSDEVESFEE